MRFRLTYEGELRSTQGEPQNGQRAPLAAHKQSIRKVFHGQLKTLWQTSKFLRDYKVVPSRNLHIPPGEILQSAGIFDIGQVGTVPLAENIATNFHCNGYRFVPLVCEQFSLLCSLNVLFLRRDFPLGIVVNHGDLDNRVKTLIDGLRMPKSANELRGNETPAPGEDPFFCLLEDDDLVTSLSVETGMLLDPPVDGDGGIARVKLIVSVELKPDDVTMFNLGFA